MWSIFASPSKAKNQKSGISLVHLQKRREKLKEQAVHLLGEGKSFVSGKRIAPSAAEPGSKKKPQIHWRLFIWSVRVVAMPRAAHVVIIDPNESPRVGTHGQNEDSRIRSLSEEMDSVAIETNPCRLPLGGLRLRCTTPTTVANSSIARFTSPTSTAEIAATPPFMLSRRHHSFFNDDDSNSETSVEHDMESYQATRGSFPTLAEAGPSGGAAVTLVSSSATIDADHGLRSCTVDGEARQKPNPATHERLRTLCNVVSSDNLFLYRYEELPHWQKYNPSIRSGYRAYYTTTMLLKSFWGWHNETINILSHFLGCILFLIFTILLYVDVLDVVMSPPTLQWSRGVYGFFCFGCILCMLNSTLYHLFAGHESCAMATAMGRFDFIGITILIVASFIPPLYVAFHCFPLIRAFYISCILCLGLAGIVGPWTQAFHQHLWVRTGTFLGMGLSGIIPAVHSVFVMPINASSSFQLVGLLLMAILYCIGVFFYVSKFPESKYPGHFDRLLSSHQLWHFFVLMAALVHFCNCVGIYQLWSMSDGYC